MTSEPAIPYVGRGAELFHLTGKVRLAAEGHGQVAFLVGEAGIGKTRLIEEVLAGCPPSTAVFRGGASELDSRRPFGTIADCLGVSRNATETRRGEIARLLVGGAEAGAEMEFRLVEAFVALVEDTCVDTPVIVVVDDLQWADPATLMVLHRLGRIVRDLSLLILGACRPTPRPAPLAQLMAGLAERGSPAIELDPLDAEAVSGLLAAALGVAPGPLLSQQAAAAGGNPFFVTELVAALRADGSITLSDGVAEIGAVAMPTALKLTIIHRLSFLRSATIAVLQMASMLGTAFSVHHLCALLHRSAIDLAPNLREAIDAGVVIEDAGRIAFRHDLLREALYEDLALSLRMTLHDHVAKALIQCRAPAVQVAEHFIRAAQPGDAEAVLWLQRAADDVTVQSPAIAADLLNRALELFAPGDRDRDLILVDWAISLEMLGRIPEAEAACRELLTRKQSPRTEARVRLCLSRALATAGRVNDALEQNELALAIEGLSAVQRARMLATAANLPLAAHDSERAADLATRALAAGDAAHDDVARTTAALTMATIELRRARFVQALEWTERFTVTHDEQPNDRMAQGWQHLNTTGDLIMGSVQMYLDRVDDARTALLRGRRNAAHQGFKRLLAAAHRAVVILCFRSGEWDDAIAEYHALAELWDATNDDQRREADVWGVRALIAIHRGELDAARVLLTESGSPAAGFYGASWPAQAEALLAEASGAPEAALAALSSVWDQCVTTGLAAALPAVGPELVRLAIDHGDRVRAHDASEAVAAVATSNEGVASLAGDALWCRGLLASDAEMLVAASRAYEVSGRPLPCARAREEGAALLGCAGQREAARPLFEDAIRCYEQLDARWDSARAAQRMRALGLRRGSRGARRRPTSGWEALSPSELAVTELVAAGLSNSEVADQLFLATGTVKCHVSSALRKLALSSRLELARVAIHRQQGATNL